jgi:C-terminal processing protease CtpA/Prc
MAVIILFSCNGGHVFGQCQSVVSVFNEEVIYDIAQEKYREFGEYHFPEYANSDTIINRGYKPLKKKKNTLYWVKEFEQPIFITTDSTFIYLQIYIKNIHTCRIILETMDGEKLTYRQTIDHDQYQIPLYIFADKWEKSNSTTACKNVHIRKIELEGNIKETKGKSEFVIANFKLIRYNREEKEYNHPFFKQIAQKSYHSPQTSFSNTGETYLLSTFSEYSWEDHSNSLIRIKNNNWDTEKSIKEVFRYAFEKYPFYKERNISQTEINRRFAKIYGNDSIKGNALWDSLRNIVNSFNDPHFTIPQVRNKAERQKTTGPIRLYGFLDKIYISAVFDTALFKQIKPGMQVLRIDDNDIDAIFPSSHYPDHKNVENLLYKYPEETTFLRLYDGKDTLETMVSYNRKPVIPPNFMSARNECRTYNNNQTVYFHISSWNLELNTWVYNHIKELQQARNLILDLRNNPGGNNEAAIRFASLFISDPTPYFHSEYNWDKNTMLKETLVIKPHPVFNLSHLKIVILINRQTYCASEAFIDFMKTHMQATKLVGAEKTGGAFANVYTLKFEDGNTVRINSLVKIYPGSQAIMESKGILPDIWVSLNKIEDLAPFEDKVLKTAVILGQQKNGIKIKKKVLTGL